ncbi:MAG: hypothetical protein K2Q22_10835 [Cytophagales bacterium]|nr:hypothetical protein [Cytophagales bacterium]
MKSTVVVAVTLFSVVTYFQSQAQVGIDFPKMPVKTLYGKMTNLPDTVKGKKSLLVLSFSPKSEKYMEAWLTPIYNTFINQTKNPLFIGNEEDQPNLLFVPMVTGIYQVVDDKVYDKLKAGIDPSFYQYIMLYSGALKPYKEVLKFGAKDVPYFFVLDKNGKIIHVTSGEYSEAKMDEILKFTE